MGMIEGLAERVVEHNAKLEQAASDYGEVLVPPDLWEEIVSGARLELDVGQLGSKAQRTIDDGPIWPTSPEPAFPPDLEQQFAKIGVVRAAVAEHFGKVKKRPARPAPKKLEGKPFDLGIIACSKVKAPGAGLKPARQLYTGQIFKLALAVSEKLCGETAILSAKHNVLGPNEALLSYDQKIPTGNGEAALAWTDSTAELLHQRYLKGHKEPRRVLVLAGENYFRLIKVALVLHRVEQPLKGIGIGRQKSALKKMLAEAMVSEAA